MRKTLGIIHEMTNDDTGELAAVTVILGLHIDTRLRASCALPSKVRERAQIMIAGSSDFDIGIAAGAQIEQAQPGRVT